MGQLLRLLRGKCVYCGRLKMHPTKVNYFTCKLRLLDHGLLKEAEELENFSTRRKSMLKMVYGHNADGGGGSEDDSEDEMDIKEMRTNFTKRAIRKAGAIKSRASPREKVEALSEQRRAVVKEFLSDITKGNACGHCNG